MIILGIDPALGCVGWGVIEVKGARHIYLASGVIKTTTKESITQRLAAILNKIEDILNIYKPSLVAMEETFVNINADSSLKLGYARGAIMAIIGKYNLNLEEFKPNKIKKTVTGAGHAEKAQVMHMIKILLPEANDIQKYDEADALAVAYTCSVIANNQHRYI